MNRSPTLRDQVLAAAAAAPSPTRSSARHSGALLYACATSAMLAVFFAAGGLGHSDARPAQLTWTIAVGALVLSAITVFLVARRRASMLDRPRQWLVGAMLLLPVATFAWLTAFSARYAAPAAKVGWRCLGLTIALAALPLAVVMWRRRGTATASSAWLGAAFGAASAGCAAVFVDLWCPLTDVSHVAVGHVLPLFGLMLVGAAVGRLVLPLQNR